MIAIVVNPVGTDDRRLRHLWRDGGPRTGAPEVLTESVAGEAAVGHDPQRDVRQSREQGDRLRQLMRLARGDAERDRLARGVGDHASLGAVAAAGTAERIAFGRGDTFLAAPAAFW
jgi:hypothetical protein